ncbi:Ig-like domain-containing protein [Eubacterium ramulus]|uniref:Ig-like domain-containing protein n=1 Tax=Eubacterium ramulus TaxID=39490 RepID=UPI00300E9661
MAYVYGKDKYGNSYRERSEPFYVKMEKESSGNYLTVNGEMLSDPSRENSNFPYMVPAGVTKLNFEHKIYPSDSTIDSYWNYTYKWFSSDPQIVNIDSDTGQAEALRPGSATVGYRIYNSSGAVCQENSCACGCTDCRIRGRTDRLYRLYRTVLYEHKAGSKICLVCKWIKDNRRDR